MFLPQSLEDYLDSPMGKGSTAVMNKQLIKKDLDSRYEKLLKDNKDFKHKIYTDGSDYYFHFEIPSESERENTYDVVIQFTMGEDNFKMDPTLKRYYLKFFSNCPSFTYTFAYAYNDNDLLIDFLGNKYDDIVLTNNPVVRNPSEIISFEKSTYFACKYLSEHKTLLNKIAISATVRRLTSLNLIRDVRSSATISREIKKETQRIKEEKRKKEEKTFSKIKKKEDVPKVRSHKQENKSSVNRISRSKKITPSSKIRASKKIGGR